MTQFIRTDGGKTAAGFIERNDCAVRAFALFTGKPYAEAHATFKKMGRRSCKGTPMTMIDKALNGFSKHVETMSLSALIRKFPKGRVYAVKRGHAFTLIDGVRHDNFEVGMKSRVKCFWVDSSAKSSPAKTHTSESAVCVENKKERARVIFDRLNGTMTRSQMAKHMAAEMNITVANATYYCTRCNF